MVRITDFGRRSLKRTIRRNGRIKDEIDSIVKRLVREPEMGKELTSDLFGMRAVSSSDGRYRVVYELESSRHEVVIHAVGKRKHVYDDLARMLKRIMPYSRNESSAGGTGNCARN